MGEKDKAWRMGHRAMKEALVSQKKIIEHNILWWKQKAQSYHMPIFSVKQLE